MSSRKDYRAVAQILYDERMYAEDNPGASASGTIARLAQRFEAVFAEDNPRFDPERFEAAVYRDHQDPVA
jgi:hypothetical protein